MTETPQQPPTAAPHQEPPGGPSSDPTDPPRGETWNTQNLKDFKQLRRSRTDRQVAGVAGGLGRHLNIDPTILRVLFVVLAFFGGAGVILYAAVWLFVPEEDTGETVVSTSEPVRNAIVIGALVVAALAVVGDSWGGVALWPIALGGIVVVVWALSQSGSATRTSAPPSPTHQAAWVPPAPVTGETGYVPGQAPVDPWSGYVPPPPAPVAPRRGPLLFGPTLALVALALGALGLYDSTGGSVVDAAYPAVALTVVGAMLVLGAFVGRPGGLILLGTLAAVALPATALSGPGYSGDRDLQLRPSAAAAVQDSYDVPAGRIYLDLRDVRDLEALDGRTIALSTGAGELQVVVPDGVEVDYSARVAYGGEIQVEEVGRGGWEPSAAGTLNEGSDVELDLELDVQFGRIMVSSS